MNKPSANFSNLQPGQICGFFDKEHFFIGLIESVSEKAVLIFSDNNIKFNLHPARLVILSKEVYPLTNLTDTMDTFKSEVSLFSSTFSAETIWKQLKDLHRELTMQEIIKLCNLPETDVCRFALYGLLKESPFMFRHKGDIYLILNEQESLAAMAAEKEHREEQEFRKSVGKWMEQISAIASPFLPLDRDIQSRLETELSLHPYSKPIKWLNYIFHSLSPERSYEDSLISLRIALGQIDDNTDSFLAVSGLPALFPQAVSDEAESIQPYEHDKARLDLTGLECWTIDAEDTEDIDDAISIQDDSDGWILGIHISDVSTFVAPDSVIDNEAEKRTSSIYLPDSTIHMLPAGISCDKASLQVGKERPALTLLCRIDSDYSITSSEIVLSTVKINNRFTYEEFEQYLNIQNPDAPIEKKVSVLHKIMEKHLQYRIDHGAIIVANIEQTPSRSLVAELMVIYNSRMAAFAKEHKLPFFYRYLEELITEQVLNDDNDRLIFPASVLGVKPIPHQAMGLEIYAQLTSPLRRYADLINQRQVISCLTKSNYLYNADKLEKLIQHLTQTRQVIRKVTNQSERQWQLNQANPDNLTI